MVDAAAFWEKVQIGSDDECWEWTGCRIQTGYIDSTGYGWTSVVDAERFKARLRHLARQEGER